jgi:glycosyltransferase involved in cell wall biosynthesis
MLSVIIPSYDQPEMCAVHVRECMNGTVIPDEIIVVNDHGPEELKEMLQKLDKKTKIVYAYINEDIPWNYTGARNLGVWLSRGELLSIEDCDNIPSQFAYEKGLQYMKKNPSIDKMNYGRRIKVSIDDVLNKSAKEWKSLGGRKAHRDTAIYRRDAYLLTKGCDERFAGEYAWASTDWVRRWEKAGLTVGAISEFFYTVIGGETKGLVWSKSWRNFTMAREQYGHTQSPIGILNFTYTYEIL